MNRPGVAVLADFRNYQGIAQATEQGALGGAEAMLPERDLDIAPVLVI